MPLPPPPPQCKQPNAARGIFAGIGAALGIIGSALMVPVTGGASLALAGTIVAAGVASGVYNGVQAGQGTCS